MNIRILTIMASPLSFQLGLVAASLALMLPGPRAQARDADDKYVAVQGSCTRSVTPDRGSVTLTAQARDKDLKAASRKAGDIYERMRASVIKLKLADQDLQSSEYSLREDREWVGGKAIFKGFIARMGLTVRTSEIGRLGEVLAIGSREGSEEIGNLTTFMSEELMIKEQLACLEDAAQNARSKAEKLAGALGAKVGAVRILSETQLPAPGPVSGRAMMKYADSALMEAAPQAAQVEAGKQTIGYSIHASFELK